MRQRKEKRERSAGGVVLNDDGEVLVVNQKRRAWSLPKGKVEEGEDDLAAARREIGEESGVYDLTYVGPLGRYRRYAMDKDGGDDKTRPKKEIVICLFVTSQRTLKPIDPDNPEARWVPREEVAALLTHRKDKRFFLSILKDLPRKK
jgi:8-oxo-dGTP pyrophosphatase MutT (NUDIX family)